MKRIVIVLLVVAALALLTLPGAVGWIAQQGHGQVVDQLQAAGHEIEAEHYERGWFSSAARHRFALADPQWREIAHTLTGEEGPVSVVVASQFDHGPMPALGTQGASLTPAWTEARSMAALRTHSGANYPLPGTLTSRVEADGRTRFEYRAESGQDKVGTVEARWKAAAIDAELSRSADTLGFSGTIGGIELADGQESVALGTTELSGMQRRQQSGLWVGNTDWRIASLSAANVSADNIEVGTHVTESAGDPSYRLSLRLGRLETGAYAGEAIEADIGLRNVDPAALADLLELAALGRPLDVFEPEQRALLQRIVASGPVITLYALRLPTHDAAIEGNAALELERGTRLDGRLSDSMKGNADLVVPIALVDALAAESTDQMRAVIELMIAFGMLQAEDRAYRLKAKYASGLLTVNGLPVPLPAF